MTVDNVGLTQNGETLDEKPRPPARRRAKMKKAPLPPPCIPSQQTNGTIQNCEQMASPHPGDDCAINELLEGTMDLEVVLPDGRCVRMTIERRMPMMDLLVQATTANKISPGGHVITLSPEGDRDNLRYKPSTPIGSLDTNTVYIMSKSAINDPSTKKVSRSQLQPFEPTFRLQVNLPRNQLMVMRVSPKTTLAEIKKMVCADKGFDATRYHLVHPTQPNYLIDLNCKLSDYGGTEISLMSDLSVTASIRNSTSDLIGYAGGEDEKKRKKLLGIFKRKSKSVNNMMIAGETFRDTASSRGISPARSDICDTHSLRAKRQSTKKRAPPPPPPPVEQPPNNENSTTAEIPVIATSTTTSTTVTTTMVSHSRQSSDSSGYHEASVLSDCPDNLSPETSSGCASSGVGIAESPVQHYNSAKRNSRTPTREKPNFSSVAHSTMLIISTSKKRRAPPPPPLNSNKETGKKANETGHTVNKDILSKPVNGEPVNLTNIANNEKTENISTAEPVSPDSLPTSPAISESNASCSPPTSPVCNDTFSSESSVVSSPVHSPSLLADNSVEAQTQDSSNISNHCHTEEETGEVIHLLEKDVKDQKNRQSLDVPLSTQDDLATMSEIPKNESQIAAEVKTGEVCDTKQNEKDVNGISSVILPPSEEALSTEDEYVAISDVEWDFSIPEPPSPFRNSIDNFQPPVISEKETETKPKDCDDLCEPSVDSKLFTNSSKTLDDVSENSSNVCSVDDAREKSWSVSSVQSSTPSLPSSYPPREEIYRAGSESSDVAPPLPISEPPSSSSESDMVCLNEETSSICSASNGNNDNNNNVCSVSISNDNPGLLENKTEKNITSHAENGNETGEITGNRMYVVVPQPYRRAHLQNFTIGSYKNESGVDSVPWDCLQEEKRNKLNANRQNLLKHSFTNVPFNNTREGNQQENLAINDEVRVSPYVKSQAENHVTERDQISYSMKKDESTKIEEEKLQEEYKKLQNQLIAWQQQLAKNQTLLQQKQIVSKMNVPVISSVSSKPEHREQQAVVYRSQTLPRTKPTMPKEPDESVICSSTMEYHLSSKPQVLTNVTIGSWKSQPKDVFSSNAVSDTKPKFKTLAPIISLPRTNTTVLGRSGTNLSLNADGSPRKSSHISATFDVKPSGSFRELANSSVTEKKGLYKELANSLGMEKTGSHRELANISSGTEKTDGNPALILAQIRNEIKASSKHPAGISVSPTNTNANFDSSRFQNSSTKEPPKVSIKSKPLVTYSYFGNPSTSSRSTSQTMVSHTKKEFPENKKDEGFETKPVVIATIKSRNSWGPTGIEIKDSNNAEKHSSQKMSAPPLAPPLPPTVVPLMKHNNKLSDSQIKISRTDPPSDPREELMIEIRKFGGRTALRKVPHNQAGWHLKVFGTLSSTPV